MEVCRILLAKHVSLAAQGVNQFGVPAVLEFTTQAGNVNFDHVTESFPVEIVKMLQQLSLRDDRARPVRQIFKNAVFHRGQGDEFSLAAHAEISRVDLQIADLQQRSALALAAADQGFCACQQLSEIEWFG